MNLTDVIALVNTNRGQGRKESLDRMYRLLEKTGNPQKELAFVHIAGTNGKGSTASFIASILKHASIKTGIFTSPHLERVNERIRIDDTHISDEEFIKATEKVAPYVDEVEEELNERLYSFEILTAVALVYFAEQNCELVVLEAGIGGRLDATNTIPTPEVAVITSIGMDHMKMLGDSLEKIASEKAGIIKENGTVVIPSLSENIEEVFNKAADRQNARIEKVINADITNLVMTDSGSKFSYKQFKDIEISLIGEHQVMNASLAIEAALVLKEKGYHISHEDIVKGAAQAYWPGRMEKIQESPDVFIDGAHNPEGVQTLMKTIQKLFPGQELIFAVGMMKDKNYMSMIEEILPVAKKVHTVSPDPYRGFDAEEVAGQLEEKGIPSESYSSVEELVRILKQIEDKNEKIVVFGSLYLIGDIKKYW